MSAKDLFHNSICRALEKDGWQITHDPLYLKIQEVEFFIDLGAERVIAFLGEFIQESILEYGVKLLIVNIPKEEIFLWKE